MLSKLQPYAVKNGHFRTFIGVKLYIFHKG